MDTILKTVSASIPLYSVMHHISNNYWIHAALWGFMVLFILDYHWYEVSWLSALSSSVIEVLSYVILFYITLWLFNRFQKNIVLLILSIIGCIALYVAILIWSGLEDFFYEAEGLRNVYSMVLNSSLFTGLAVLFGTVSNTIDIKQKNLELRATNKELQLKSLKSRINPHFIFNMLNNLNALIISKDKKLPDFLHDFSSLLRYSIDEGTEGVISLQKELDTARSYIRLLHMQEPASSDIDLFIEGDPSQKKIIPFIISSMVENAIKHSDIQVNENAHLHINISIENHEINVDISNSFENSEGVRKRKGIELLRNQLRLHYGKDYQLSMSDENDTYRTQLSIFSSKIIDQ